MSTKKKAVKNGKVCFVISPIGKPESDTRKRSDKVMKYVINPPVEEKGYKVIRADSEADSNMITPGVIKRIIESELVIADLTDQNPNVYYELAIRHATRKPYIQIIEGEMKLPFDVADVRTHSFDLKDLDKVEECKEKIKECITRFEANPDEIVSPISIADALIKVASENPEGSEVFIDLFDNIKNDIRRLTMRFESFIESGSINDERSEMLTEELFFRLRHLISNLKELEMPERGLLAEDVSRITKLILGFTPRETRSKIGMILRHDLRQFNDDIL